MVILRYQENLYHLAELNNEKLDFRDFFENNLEFQDYALIAKKINFIILRNINQMDENNKNYLYRFISFIDALYENKVVLSLSSDVQLNQLYLYQFLSSP